MQNSMGKMHLDIIAFLQSFSPNAYFQAVGE